MSRAAMMRGPRTVALGIGRGTRYHSVNDGGRRSNGPVVGGSRW